MNGLVNQVLNDRITSDFVALDIGGSYGPFSALFKRNHPDSHHVLVDFSEQLLLAYYFLGMYFPEAKIAGVKEISDQANISREFIEQYDFVLAPVEYYTRLAPKSVDLVSNFRSLGEMSRKWFETYVDADVFTSAKYFFTANRVQSYPSYNSDLSILDYPIWDRSKRLHFELSPLLSHTYGRSFLFFNKRSNHSPVFEYLGEI
jgi:hypothetical protein